MNKLINLCKYLCLRKGEVFYGEEDERVFVHRKSKGYVSYRHVFHDGSYGPAYGVDSKFFFSHFHKRAAWVLCRKNHLGKDRYYYGDARRNDGVIIPTFCESIDCAKVYHNLDKVVLAARTVRNGVVPERITEWEEE